MFPVRKPALICCLQGENRDPPGPKPPIQPQENTKEGKPAQRGHTATPGKSGSHPGSQNPPPTPGAPPAHTLTTFSRERAGRPACQSARGRVSIGKEPSTRLTTSTSMPPLSVAGFSPGIGPSPCRTRPCQLPHVVHGCAAKERCWAHPISGGRPRSLIPWDLPQCPAWSWWSPECLRRCGSCDGLGGAPEDVASDPNQPWGSFPLQV